MEIKTIGIVGAGVMGGGIAQMFAEHGREVLIKDADAQRTEGGIAVIRKRLDKSAEKGKITADQVSEIMARIHPAETDADLVNADLVIEAVIEDVETKTALYKSLSGVLKESAILATNTSCLSVTELARASGRPERFVGVHFFNPPTRLELVELAAGEQTDAACLETVRSLLDSCGKTPILVKDAPGFIVNRLLLSMINEAAKMVEEGVASPEDIDAAMRLGAAMPAGPLYVADLVGLDVCEKCLDILHERMPERAHETTALIRRMVGEGRLGRKTAGGFFE